MAYNSSINLLKKITFICYPIIDADVKKSHFDHTYNRPKYDQGNSDVCNSLNGSTKNPNS